MAWEPPIPLLRIQPGSVFIFDQFQGSFQGRPSGLYSQAAQVRKYTGLLTPSAKRRLIKAINLLVAISLPKRAPYLDRPGEFTFRVNFITLTLPAEQSTVQDSELKSKCLAPLLRIWQRQHEGMSYVWRAERQKNSNLHFHLLTDRYIHWQQIRDQWNSQLAKFHFITTFKERHGHYNPNSTDVHGVKKIRNLANYIAKYMSKDTDENKPTPGRCWDCSKNLKTKERTTFIRDSQVQLQFDALMKRFESKTWSSDFSQGIRLTEEEMKTALPASWQTQYATFLQSVRNAAYS